MPLEEVHVTGLRSFLRCRRKWYYEVERGLKRTGVPSAKAGTGTYFHAGMRALYGGASLDESVLAMVRKSQEEPGGDGLVAEDMVRYYWEQEGAKEDLGKILQVELPLYYQYKGFELRGTMDLVYQQGERIVVRDYKTVDKVGDDPNYIRLDFQFQTYLFLIWKHYQKPVELEVVRVRRAVPPGFGGRSAKTPTGRPSKASTDPKDYIQKIRWYFSVPQLQKFEERLHGVLDSIAREREEKLWIRSDSNSPIDGCPRCPYFELCGRELLEGEIPEDEIELLFTPSQEGEVHGTDLTA